MAGAPPQELSPRWYAILDYLEANGGLEPAGFQPERQEAFAEAVGIPFRTLKAYLTRMEEYRVIAVTRTTVTGGFGSPRAPNIYRLRVTSEQWRTMGPQVVEKKADMRAKRAAARASVARMEKERRQRAQQPRPVGRPAAAAGMRLDEIELVVQVDDDDDLDGW